MRLVFLFFTVFVFLNSNLFAQEAESKEVIEQRQKYLDNFFKENKVTENEKLNIECELSYVLYQYQYENKENSSELVNAFKTILSTYRNTKTIDYSHRIDGFERRKYEAEEALNGLNGSSEKLVKRPRPSKDLNDIPDYDKASTCTNSDLENGDLNDWNLSWGTNAGTGSANINFSGGPDIGAMNGTGGQHCLMGPGAGTDSYTNGNLPRVYPGGGQYSMRVGDQGSGARAAKASYSFVVTPQTELFIYHYAVVLQDPGHTPNQQPYMSISLIIGGGGVNEPCGAYYQAAAANAPGYLNGSGTVRYRPWVTVSISLTQYMGQVATIEFITADCSPTAHFGYAYIDAECLPMPTLAPIDINCFTPIPTIPGPPGADDYSWTGPGIVGPSNTQDIQVNAPGTYEVTVIPVSGIMCAYTLQTTVTEHLGTVTATPTISPMQLCIGGPISFQSSFTFTGDAGAIDSLNWYFGDGNSSTSGNINYTYTVPDIYQVMLTVITENGCTDTVVQNVTVFPEPVADFVPDSVCAGQLINLVDASTIIPDNGDFVNSWSWNFGDGNTANGQVPGGHQYATENVYTVTLNVVSNNGCINSISKDITVFPNPVADFSFADNCLNDITGFLDNSNVSNNNSSNVINNWSWDFGNGNSANTQNTDYTYPSEGVYNVALTVTTDRGCTNTQSYPINIYPNPAVAIMPSESCFGKTHSFADNSTISNAHTSNQLVSWDWDFGSGNTDSGQTPTYTFPSDGTFNISLTVTSDHGCVSTGTFPVTVYPNPSADFIVDTVCQGVNITVQNLSQPDPNNGGSIVQWDWDWDDGNTGTGQNPAHIFAGEGVYDISLHITTDHGCVDSISKVGIIYPNPDINFIPTEVCFGELTNFTDATTISNQFTNNSLATWTWDFGDGSGANTQNTSHDYSSDGLFNVTLTVTSNNNCTTSHTIPVNVWPIPVASFQGIDVGGCPIFCPDIVSTSTINVTGDPTSIIDYEWTLGDGTIVNTTDPKFPLCLENDTTVPITFDLNLMVTSDKGCFSEYFEADFITVDNRPFADFYFSPEFPDITIVNPQVNFTNASSLAINYEWDFGGLDTSTVEHPIFIFPSVSETHLVTLVASTQNMCTDTMTKEVQVIIPDVVDKFPNIFSPNGDMANDNFHLVFHENVQRLNVVILNRWGNVVFESEDINFQWNGKINNSGADCSDGVYFYKAEITDYHGNTVKKHGFVHLVRN